jgi:hypothetical protein
MYEFAIYYLNKIWPIDELSSKSNFKNALDIMTEADEKGFRDALIKMGMIHLGYFREPNYDANIVRVPAIGMRYLESCRSRDAYELLRDAYIRGYSGEKSSIKALAYDFAAISSDPESNWRRDRDSPTWEIYKKETRETSNLKNQMSQKEI